MAKLILVKHARPKVEERLPSSAWTLSDEGRAACGPLGERLRGMGVEVVVASEEPKAAETGRIVAAGLGVPFEVRAGLEEHDRSNVPHMETREFISHMAHFFQRRSERVLGRESADEALARLQEAVDGVLSANDGRAVAVVTHGTVLSLFLGAHNHDVNAFQNWRRMQLPSYAVVSVPGYQLAELVERL
jgi:broad specificity phosphatase PhoE